MLCGAVIRHVLKTNFYQPTKVALSFRFNPTFLPEVEYPVAPFGLFLSIGASPSLCPSLPSWGCDGMLMVSWVTGNEFRGFHMRFRDVARGGIRIVRSRNKEYV